MISNLHHSTPIKDIEAIQTEIIFTVSKVYNISIKNLPFPQFFMCLNPIKLIKENIYKLITFLNSLQ
jgi:hypothetical protein